MKPQTPPGPGNPPQTPPGTRQEGKPEKPPSPPVGLTEAEKKELVQLREIKKTTGFNKFTESAREALRLKKRNEELEDKLVKANEALTEKELENDPEYELMSDEEKKAHKARKILEKDIVTLKAKEQWRDDYKKLPIDVRKKIDEKGGEEVFKDYACSPDNAGQKNLLNLAKSFLYEEKQPEAPNPPVKPKPGLEEVGGGERAGDLPEEGFTADEISNMRKNDPRRYAKLASEGRLKIRKSK